MCGIAVIWEDNLEHRDESLDINETKVCNCHWHSFKENIQTDQGRLFTWEGRGFLWCCVTESFDIQALTEGQPLFSYNEQYATASFPLHCWPSMQENHNHAFVTVHECCKHKNIKEIKLLNAVATLWWFNRPLVGNKHLVVFLF